MITHPDITRRIFIPAGLEGVTTAEVQRGAPAPKEGHNNDPNP
jgi:hypothetical protein